MHRTLKHAAIAGILYLIVSFPLIVLRAAVGALKTLDELTGSPIPLYIFVLLVALVLYIIFVWGFKVLGEQYQNNLLKIVSYVLIVIAIIHHSYLISVSISPALENILVEMLSVVLAGAAMIPFGIGLLKLKIHFGSVATATGVLEIISGISLLTFLLSFIGILLIIPTYILGVIILFRAARKLEAS
jgi:hypothetical protein